MQKTFEQILLEGQAAGCETEEELFLYGSSCSRWRKIRKGQLAMPI